MLVDLEADQEFFRDTTVRFLADKVPTSTLRDLRDNDAGFDDGYWRFGAELGWTSLLVDEADGGGSVSESGLVDLSLVAYAFGAAAAPGPLLPVAIVAGALSSSGGHEDVLASLLDGTTVASWCYGEGPPNEFIGSIRTEIRRDGSDLVLDGVKRPVESANRASQLLVTGHSDGGITQVIVPSDSTGITVRPMHSVDLTRRFSVVEFDGVRVPSSCLVGEFAAAAPSVAKQLAHALAITCAESVGAMQSAFDMTLEWAFDRYAFGRPLASYQALKHRFADMATWLQASHAISDDATLATAAGSPDAPKLLSAAKAYVGSNGSELVQDCVQIHGGIGVTYEHDLHLFLRRHTLGRALWGTPSEHRRVVAEAVIEEGRAA